ncbi:hypothetical protein SNOG_07100 [Parastagonospora nodorum SN15]|uniref:NADH:ubiquinone oxidoreductase intermediate-associated protein 30 domain-containing protein n=1 Tax=Phaeosphaeria nodorum (strain SN15 / ATCC MYA-4574 / FGSC 10173) TaxID=321614 RepID=Q0UMB4_PHANO|nr:hypothetical protein SNOG_07100 [Parastagonospora nodorum SN15]EAT85751.2 hypothetical protein SNOG_07100 [Parastagonospora nodorum SN15]
MEKSHRILVLFGGSKGWNASDWTASDDRVRGGASQSYLDCSSAVARFHGNLDIKTLGGAGFASQRTTLDDKPWDLSSYSGVHLDLGKADGKKYTFVIKDEILPLMEDGREQKAGAEGLYIPWSSLKPTYRGKEKKDAGKLDLKNVRRFSIMSRSFFGGQEGDFSLEIKAVKAVRQSSDLEGGIQNVRLSNKL